MTTITWPAALVPTGANWVLRANTQEARSPLSGAVQTYELPGVRWACTLHFDSMGEAEAALFRGLTARCRGRSQRVAVPFYPRIVPRGAGGGTPRLVAPNNLLLRSETFGNSAWTKTGIASVTDAARELWYGEFPGDGTKRASLLVENTGNSEHVAVQSLSLIAGERYTLSVYVNRTLSTVTKLNLEFDNSFRAPNGMGATFDLSAGSVNSTYGDATARVDQAGVDVWGGVWLRVSVTGRVYTAATDVVRVRACDATYQTSYTGTSRTLYLFGAQVAPAAAPWIYAATTTAAVRNTQNLVRYSEQLNNAYWTTAGGSFSVDAVTAPDGAVSADIFIENTSTGAHAFSRAITSLVGGRRYTLSFWAKEAGRTHLQVSVTSTYIPESVALFDFANTLVDATSNAVQAATISGDVSSNWKRCTVTVAVPEFQSAGTSVTLAWTLHNGTTTSYTGDGASGAVCWGIQLQDGPTADNYVQVTTAEQLGTYWGIGDRALYLDGLPASVTWLKEGDALEIGGELKLVTADVVSDAAGGARVSFEAPLRTSIVMGREARTATPVVEMIMESSDAAWDISAPGVHSAALSFVEAWSA